MEASAAAPAAPPAAPGGAEGQGEQQESVAAGLYPLDGVPEELRPYMEQQLRRIDGNITKKFQEHSDYRRRWEPYEQIEGFSDMPPEDVAALIQFAQMASDPQQFQQWLGQAIETTGFVPENIPQEAWNEIGQRNGWLDDTGAPATESGQQESPVEQLTQVMQELLDQRLGPIEESVVQSQQEAAYQRASEEIASELEQLHGEFGEFDDEAVAQMAYVYAQGPDALRRGLEDYLRVTGQSQSSLIDSKLGQPNGALSGGRPDTAPEEFNGINDPRLKDAALARFRSGA